MVPAAIPEALQRQAPGHGGGPVLTPRGSTDVGTSPLTVAGTTAPGSQLDRPLNDNILNPQFISSQRHLLNMHSICGTGGGGGGRHRGGCVRVCRKSTVDPKQHGLEPRWSPYTRIRFDGKYSSTLPSEVG